MIVRRVHGTVIEVIFPKPLAKDGKLGSKLEAWATTKPDIALMRAGEEITGVECDQKDFINFLVESGSSKETIAGVRAALDESKKAQRARMRGDPRPRN